LFWAEATVKAEKTTLSWLYC